MSVIEMGEIVLVRQRDIACSFVPFVVEPGMRVTIENGSDVCPVDMRRYGDLLQIDTHISYGTGEIGRSIVGTPLSLRSLFINNLGLYLAGHRLGSLDVAAIGFFCQFHVVSCNVVNPGNRNFFINRQIKSWSWDTADMSGIILAGPVPGSCPATVEEFEVGLIDYHAYCVVIGGALVDVVVHVDDIEWSVGEFFQVLDEVGVVLLAYFRGDGAVDVEVILQIFHHRELDRLGVMLPGDAEASEVDTGHF